ncbi:hypothetical protein C8F04DRAFT_1273624 [Mycena alexandri]|uniref:Uncharacterized protein n=1 Tax=Mycena alexandri TaxID=1745969 RepID=A0AAD6WNX1_9AGAR|nr:hypothetical protein C8F04DRAFT_1273624 [Mycena alexandri]
MAAQPKEEGDWEAVIKLHGKNGLLQLMATLLWWGEKAMEESPLDRLEWLAGVEDATRVLTEVLRPGVIKKANKKAATAAKEGKTAPAKRGAAEMEEDAPRRGRSAKGKNPLHNPDGHHDLVVFPSPNAPRPGLLDLPAELPEGSKRAKRAPNRDIPMPLSYKSQVVRGAADAAQAKHDAMWVEKLTSGKRRAALGNDENTVPAAKK